MSDNPYLGISAEKPPSKIGKYEIAGLLGKGASGLVYKAFDPFVGRDVAIKIALHLAEEPRHLGGSDAPPSSFFTEARAAGMLSHPNVVALYDAGMEDDLCYIVMEFVDGDTLLPWCRRGGPRMPLERLLDLMIKCAKGLDYSHSKGVLHRDIKPSNIMLTADGVPKIMDFSIAEITDRRNDSDVSAVGSPLYMSPEQVSRQPLGPASDLYALGAVFFQLLTGETPFFAPHLPGLFAAIRNQPAPALETRRPDLPVELGAIIAKLLAKNPTERYQQGRELANDLAHELARLRQADDAATRSNARDSLRGLTFFSAFSESEVDEVLSISQIKAFEPGQSILNDDGEMDDSFFIVATGQAIVRKGDRPLYVLSQGDCFGEIGTVGQARRATSVTAASRVLTLKLGGLGLERLTPTSRLRFYKSFSQTLIQRLAFLGGRPAADTTKTAPTP